MWFSASSELVSRQFPSQRFQPYKVWSQGEMLPYWLWASEGSDLHNSDIKEENMEADSLAKLVEAGEQHVTQVLPLEEIDCLTVE